jgi:broad specificity phosphatase PhoE
MFLNRVKEFLASYQQYPDHTVFFGHGMWIGLLAWHLMGFSIEDSDSMRLFRQFQTAMVMDNTVIYQLQCDEASSLQQFSLYSRLRNTHS